MTLRGRADALGAIKLRLLFSANPKATTDGTRIPRDTTTFKPMPCSVVGGVCADGSSAMFLLGP